MSAGELSLDHGEDGTLWIRLSGSWRIGTQLPSSDAVRDALGTQPGPQRLAFDASGVTEWDSGLLTFLRRVLRDCAGRELETDRAGLPEGIRRLLDLADAVPPKETHAEEARKPALARFGLAVLGWWSGARDVLDFVGGVTIAFARLLRGVARFPRREFLVIVQDCGASAFSIVTLVSLLVGLILAFMGALQLRNFGAEIFVADLVAIGMLRDMGPIMVGIIMAGRTGAAFAAQLGTMMVNEEIDALETMGVPPMEYLVLPRMLALMLMMPLLVVYGNALGIIGGGLVGVTSLELGFNQYVDRTFSAMTLGHAAAGLVKGTAYGVIVALAGCLKGMQSGRSAEAVGHVTTSAVVTSIVFIIVACGVLTVVYDVLGI